MDRFLPLNGPTVCNMIKGSRNATYLFANLKFNQMHYYLSFHGFFYVSQKHPAAEIDTLNLTETVVTGPCSL